MALVLDTGPIVAALDAADPDHRACAELLGEASEQLVIPAAVLPEVDYWLRKVAGPTATAALLREVRSGAFRIEEARPADYERIAELLTRYADTPVGFTDAAVLATVERLGETRLATLDRRHFTLMRPVHAEALELLPAA